MGMKRAEFSQQWKLNQEKSNVLERKTLKLVHGVNLKCFCLDTQVSGRASRKTT